MAEENKNAKIVEKTEKTEKVKKVKMKDGKEKIKLTARIKKFFKDYRSEMKKIVWPTRAQVIQNTGVVLVAIVFIALVVGALDLLFGFGVGKLGDLKSLITG